MAPTALVSSKMVELQKGLMDTHTRSSMGSLDVRQFRNKQVSPMYGLSLRRMLFGTPYKTNEKGMVCPLWFLDCFRHTLASVAPPLALTPNHNSSHNLSMNE